MATRKRIAAGLITLALSATGAVPLLQGPQVDVKDPTTTIGASYEGPQVSVQEPGDTARSVGDWVERHTIPT